jgi:4-cresol dehydrogenase (hydroxylating)
MTFFACRTPRDDQLGELVDRLRPLRLDGTIRSAMHIGNDYKVVSAAGAYPWEETGGRTPLPRDVLERQVKSRNCGAWNVSGALYGTKAQVRDARRRLRRSLKGLAEGLVFIDERMLGIARRLAKPVSKVTGIDLPGVLRVLEPVHGMTRGVPSDAMIPTNYWRKRHYPASADGIVPEEDDCGVMWLGPVAPTSGRHATAIWQIVRNTMLSHGFEPAVSLTLLTERAIDCVVNLSYDRAIDGEDARAMACHDEMLDLLVRAGYYPYRLGLHNMDKLPAREAAAVRFGQALKAALDPNGILAPGRYPY